ncbi:hypothetical protein GOBAR_AA34107 [Gossypium barbadense]|uniref:BHLH domain-containing protein n=1 Tax=Gossypium barbadense TaxID=3634 RepID=A0A2P5W656_GOSBA|nr:hypothetical protein GOBAR_AA34107 [Gossypium barbadense]
MDVDMIKSSSTEDDHHMDMMTMMMQMEKLPEFCEPPPESSTTVLPIYPNPIHDPFMALPFPVQESMAAPPPPYQPNKFKYPSYPDKKNSMAAMREMIFRIAAMQPIHIDPESIKPPKRRNVKISKDPQNEAIHYVKFLKKQVQSLEQAAVNRPMGIGFPSGATMANVGYSPLMKACQPPSHHHQGVGNMQMLR